MPCLLNAESSVIKNRATRSHATVMECPCLRPTQNNEQWWRKLQLAASASAGGLRAQSSDGESVANFCRFFSGADSQVLMTLCLKHEPSPNLNRPRTIRLRVYNSKTRISRLRIRCRERRMIHHVKRLQSKLEVHPLRETKPLKQRGIEVIDSILPQIRERRRERPDVILQLGRSVGIEHRRIKRGARRTCNAARVEIDITAVIDIISWR